MEQIAEGSSAKPRSEPTSSFPAPHFVHRIMFICTKYLNFSEVYRGISPMTSTESALLSPRWTPSTAPSASTTSSTRWSLIKAMNHWGRSAALGTCRRFGHSLWNFHDVSTCKTLKLFSLQRWWEPQRTPRASTPNVKNWSARAWR